MRQLFCKTKNDKAVFIDYDNTNVTFHILETPDLLELVKEALEQTEIGGREQQIVFEKDLGRIVATTSLVETTDKDEIVYAKRRQRDSYSRFVKNRELIKTQYIVVVLRKVEGEYNLWTAGGGRLLPKEAYDPDSQFNATHALVYDEDLVQLDTITSIRPN